MGENTFAFCVMNRSRLFLVVGLVALFRQHILVVFS